MKPVAFGRYTLLRRLARGGMAELFVARSAGPARVERLVVVKLVASHLIHDDSLLEMFADEARIAATLNHPNIGQVLDVGEVDGQYYLAMEYLHGNDLGTVVTAAAKAGRIGLPLDVLTYVGTRVCAALHCAHEATGVDGEPLEIIHRDVSPSNIMLTFQGQVKLLDFGIAKAANRLSLTRPGCIKGKVRYLSPEQLLGQPVDRRSDLFTLGISLWEAACGRHLFDAERDFEVFQAISDGIIPAPREIRRDLPEQLESVMLRALARDPVQRYDTALQMHQALECFAQSSGLPMSDLQTAKFVRDIFTDDLTRWEQARRAGKGLLAHLMALDPAEDEGDDDARPLEQTDDQETIAPASSEDHVERPRIERTGTHDRSSGAADGPRHASVSGMRTASSGPKKTHFFAGHDSSWRPSPEPDDPPRKTIAYGVTPGTAPADAIPPDEEGHGSPIRVAEVRQVAITPEGAARPVDRAEGPATEDAIDGICDAARPTVLVEENAPTARGTTRRKRPRTGDWAHQASAADDQRPGTHPYFQPDRRTIYGELPTGARRARRLSPRQWVWLGAGALVLAGSVIGVALTLRDEPSSPASGGQGSSLGSTVRITSAPTGATVFSAITGQELGKTPLDLPRATMRGQRVELHLRGYQLHALTLGDETEACHANLQPRASDPTSPQAPSN